MKIFVIDNYDSFTYNLVQYIGEVESLPQVMRNDSLTVEEIAAEEPDAIVISPGPGRPEDAGISLELIEQLGDRIPMLGVCLGQQCMAVAFGGDVVSAGKIYHGKTSQVYHSGGVLYEGINNPFVATRYHSLEVSKPTLPEELVIDAVTEQGELMGLHHLSFPLFGVQYHPESILTESGKKLIQNFLKYARKPFVLGAENSFKTDDIEGQVARIK